MGEWLVPALAVLYYVFILAISVSILLENRNPPKTIAYLLVLILLPGIGIIVFIFFGQDFRKRKIFSRKALTDDKLIASWMDELVMSFERSESMARTYLQDKVKIAKMLIRDDRAVMTLQNEVEILRNGEIFFPRLLEDIREARHHIHFEFYIFEDDHTGNEVIDLLAKRSEEGVEVRFVYDYVGSQGLRSSSIQKLKEAGVVVYPFMPVIFPSFTSRANYRNHRKIVVIDGKIGYVGGINISDRYRNDEYSKGVYWRDTHLRIHGEAVKSLQINFKLTWNFVTGSSIDTSEPYFPKHIEVDSYKLMQIAASGPDSDWASLMHAYFMAITTADDYVYIGTPYLIPNEQIITALTTAALSGLDVRILIPRESDSRLVQAASMSYVKRLLQAGVRVFLYTKGFFHAKTMVVDDMLGMIGTANMDYRSFDINFEITALVYDPGFANEMRKQFEEDLEDAIEVDLSRWDKRSIPLRLLESGARLLAPIL
ncbi:MAG: cardiolipin synthase [Bacteroidota bacterium]|nr:cardiolipin synthase [Bacteroidota bacterium]